MNHWLVKSEPGVYAYAALEKDRGTAWTGVRNYAARIHLSAMKVGDRLLYYHSGDDKAVVGIAEVTKVAYPDPTCPDDPRWVCVDVKPVQRLGTPVTLATIKADAVLSKSELVRQGRLSVVPFTAAQFARVLKLGQ